MKLDPHVIEYCREDWMNENSSHQISEVFRKRGGRRLAVTCGAFRGLGWLRGALGPDALDLSQTFQPV
jgi:hypothetical protein